jgi:hypothetical protein
LKTLLHDVLGVLAIAGYAQRAKEYFLLVAFDENLERLSVSPLRGSN